MLLFDSLCHKTFKCLLFKARKEIRYLVFTKKWFEHLFLGKPLNYSLSNAESA